jgi:hypothetical protein
MTELLSILSACGLVAAVALGFLAWERYEQKRLARARVQHRRARPARRSAQSLERRRAA